MMLGVFRCFVLLMTFTVVVGAEEECARCRLESGWGLASTPANAFDPSQTATISGEVVSVQIVGSKKEVIPGVYLLVATSGDDKRWAVRLAPEEILKKRGLAFQPQDKIQVTGSKLSLKNGPGLIATEIRCGDKSVPLRDAKGMTTWSRSWE